MLYENEITVEVDTSLENLIKILETHNFKLMEEYDLNDIYMINKDDLNELDYLKLLGKCVLIRHVIEKDKDKKMLTYKYKEYNDLGEITKQGKIKCNIDDIEKAKELFERLNFKELITINDHLLIYSNGIDEFALQSVNNKHLYIEIEDKCNYANRFYSSIDEMKEAINKYSIPIKNDDYFVKKALIELVENKEK